MERSLARYGQLSHVSMTAIRHGRGEGTPPMIQVPQQSFLVPEHHTLILHNVSKQNNGGPVPRRLRRPDTARGVWTAGRSAAKQSRPDERCYGMRPRSANSPSRTRAPWRRGQVVLFFKFAMAWIGDPRGMALSEEACAIGKAKRDRGLVLYLPASRHYGPTEQFVCTHRNLSFVVGQQWTHLSNLT